MKAIKREELGKNPLLGLDLKIPVVLKGSKTDYITSEGINLPKQIELEYQPYTKVYRVPELRDTICCLSDKALRLLSWIMYEVKCGEDYIAFNRKFYMEKNFIKSPTTVTEAIKDLVRLNIIAYTPIQGYLFTNPIYFFCGNRVEKLKDFIEIKYNYYE